MNDEIRPSATPLPDVPGRVNPQVRLGETSCLIRMMSGKVSLQSLRQMRSINICRCMAVKIVRPLG